MHTVRSVTSDEAEAGRLASFRNSIARGLSGGTAGDLQDHSGLVSASGMHLPDASGPRCQCSAGPTGDDGQRDPWTGRSNSRLPTENRDPVCRRNAPGR
ncbi:hypothetical protein NJ76_24270 [Rhodococcus sp. IITR03]|nr:hypothetical protein NJ76_24270 [Rhodococcus sp. IITR03]